MKKEQNNFHLLNMEQYETMVSDLGELLTKISNLLTTSVTLKSDNNSIAINTEKLNKIGLSVQNLQIRSENFTKVLNENDEKLKKSTSQLIENLNVIIQNLSKTFIEDIRKKIKNHSSEIGIQIKEDLEQSKCELSNVVSELTTLSVSIENKIINFNDMKPKIDSDELQKEIDQIIKESINFEKVDEILDEYAGKISYFNEKSLEHDRSSAMLDKATRNINYFLAATAFTVGITSGMSIILALK